LELVTNRSNGLKSAAQVVAVCFVVGVALELPTLMIAIVSGGAGHGDYAAARALFPAALLLTRVDGDTIGWLSIGAALLQFPIYGVLLAWAILRKNYVPVLVVASLHIIAVIVCFSGTLPNFS
jgi:hypothetical protein